MPMPKGCCTGLLIQRASLDLTAAVQSELQQLAMAAEQRSFLDGYVTTALAANIPPGEIYAEVAAWKGSVSAQQQLLRAASRRLAKDRNSELGRLFAQLEQQTRRLATLNHSVSKPAMQAQIQQARQELSESVESLQQQLSRLDPDFHRAWAERKISPEQLGMSLPETAALVDVLEYDHYLEWLRTEKASQGAATDGLRLARGTPVACIPLGSDAVIGNLVDASRRALRAARCRRNPVARHRAASAGLAAAEAALAGATVVLVSPDGAGSIALGCCPARSPACICSKSGPSPCWPCRSSCPSWSPRAPAASRNCCSSVTLNSAFRPVRHS